MPTYTVLFRRVGQPEQDAVIVHANSLDEAMSVGQREADQLWPNDKPLFTTTAILADSTDRLRDVK